MRVAALNLSTESAIQGHLRVESLLEKLKVEDRRKDEFLAMLSHELRNPLAAVSLALSMLDRFEGDAVTTAKYRATAQRQLGTLVRLVDDLLDVSRITRGSVELRKEAVDLVSIIQDAVTSVRPTIEKWGHELSVTMDSGSFRMNADATRLEQVVVNLLTNAAKYTDAGGVPPAPLLSQEAPGAPDAGPTKTP